MEFIYIGVPFRLYITPDEGTTFDEAPYCVLYQPASRKYFTATAEETDEGLFLITWDTTEMVTGNYTLEIYDSSSMDYLWKRVKDYAMAITVSATNVNKEV